LICLEKKLKKILFLLILVIVALFQITYLESLRIFNVKPDLILVLLVLVSIYFDFKKALVLSIFLGFLKDLFGVDKIALNIPLFVLWSYLVFKLSRKIIVEKNFIKALFVFLINFLHNIMRYFIISFLIKDQIPIFIFLRILILESFYTTLVSPLLFMGFKTFFYK